MPNQTKNTIKMENITSLPCLRTDQQGGRHFSFDSLIPMPESLDVVISGDPKTAVAWYLSDRGNLLLSQIDASDIKNVDAHYSPRYGLEGWKDKLAKIGQVKSQSQKEQDRLFEEGRMIVRNMRETGFPTWYEWRLANWGSKWDAQSTEIEDNNTIHFDSAWSQVEPVVRQLSMNHPEKEIRYSFCFADEPQVVHQEVWKDGKIIKSGIEYIEE